jgi:hypothetical protein
MPEGGGDSMTDLVQAGILAARRGHRQEAREYFQQALRENLQNEQAWLWMSTVVDSTAEKRVCLERALSINPYNSGARVELEKITTPAPRKEFQLRPLSDSAWPGNGGRAALPVADLTPSTPSRVVQPLAAPQEDSPRRAVAADFLSPHSLPPQLLGEEDVPPWVAASKATASDLPAEETPMAALALTGCLSITALSGILALGLLWLLGW